jgi:hypothetical protein
MLEVIFIIIAPMAAPLEGIPLKRSLMTGLSSAAIHYQTRPFGYLEHTAP